MRNIRRVIGMTVIAVMALMAFGATAVLAAPLAQSDDPVEVVPETGTETEDGTVDGRGCHCDVSREVMDQIIDRDALEAVVADALNMTVEELQEAKDSGQRLNEIAEAQEVELTDVQEAVKAAHDEMVQQALDDDLITAEQAECLLSSERGFFFGRGHGKGFRGGPRNGNAVPETEEAAFSA